LTSESKHHPSGNLALAVALAATAGFVDAFVFVNVVPVFVANMSGNLVRLGIAAGLRDITETATAGVALLGFLTGAIVATMHLDRRLVRGHSPSPAPLLVLETLLLLALALVAHTVTTADSVTARDYLVAGIGSTAMGIQAIALRRVGEIAVSTTYGTGAVVRLGEKLALGARRATRPDDARRRITIAILSSVLVSYVAGAWLATSIGHSTYLLLLPVGISALAAAMLEIQRRSPGRASRNERTL
jgi:uncharacterized membrane protein YoaK (UPF0700 family)